MAVVYTTLDGLAYTAADGTVLALGYDGISDIYGLITDRTAEDVSRWLTLRNKGYANMTAEEKAEWNTGQMKGAYNPPYDMNRVGFALNYLRDRLVEARYLKAGVFTAKEDWTAADIPTAADLTNYLKYVSVVREALPRYSTTPPTPVYSGGLNYQEANDIEKILVDVDQLITNMLAARYFSGELYSGEV